MPLSNPTATPSHADEIGAGRGTRDIARPPFPRLTTTQLGQPNNVAVPRHRPGQHRLGAEPHLIHVLVGRGPRRGGSPPSSAGGTLYPPIADLRSLRARCVSVGREHRSGLARRARPRGGVDSAMWWPATSPTPPRSATDPSGPRQERRDGADGRTESLPIRTPSTVSFGSASVRPFSMSVHRLVREVTLPHPRPAGQGRIHAAESDVKFTTLGELDDVPQARVPGLRRRWRLTVGRDYGSPCHPS